MSHLTTTYAITEISEGTKMYYCLGDVWSDDILQAHQFPSETVAKEYRQFYSLWDSEIERWNSIN